MTPILQDDWLTVYGGDNREVLRTLPDESVQCVVTSPPYWGLRDYGTPGQLGLEQTPDCGRRGKLRLRADLTDEQREYVVRRLLAEGRLDV
jgi:DNA modification methylase